MPDEPEIHLLADSTGESGVRLARAAVAQFPSQEFRLVRHRRITSTARLMTALDAVRAWNAGEADAVSRGTRAITDSRGLPVSSEQSVYAGAIFRLVGSRAGTKAGQEADDAS